MFERFTERARKVVVLAQDEARHFNHNYIGTEHLLLGLLREDEGVAAQALYSLNVALDEVREQVESIVGYGEEGTGAQAPFTPRSKKVLELALREALQLGHNYIGTEHILLGVGREVPAVLVELAGLGPLGLHPAPSAGFSTAPAAAAPSAEPPYDLPPHFVRVDVEVGENPGCDALTLPDQAEKDVLGANVIVAELQRLSER